MITALLKSAVGVSLALALALPSPAATPAEAQAALEKAISFYRTKVARHGGYVYYTSEDLQHRWGEGQAQPSQIWVQPPGTPTVGMAYLAAYRATNTPAFLDAARETGLALVQGQLASGGWTNSIDFAATGKNAPRFRKLPGGSRNHSSLDDGTSQAALRFLIRLDETLGFRDVEIHTAAKEALDALLKAQFPSGAFPQGWSEPVSERPVVKASYPDYDWKTEHRIKEYWDLPTLNDDLVSHLLLPLEEAWLTYRDDRCKAAIARLGDFLLLAQMPEPQPAWAQQYNHEMHPAWARKFEPPAIAGRESQGVLRALLEIHRITGDKKYLAPFPTALAYLERSRLPDGKLARYYELKTNRPLYVNEKYELSYDATHAPSHYGWQTDAKLDSLRKRLNEQLAGKLRDPRTPKRVTPDQADAIITALDAEGRWISVAGKETLVGQPKFPLGTRYLSSAVFSKNVEALAAYLTPSK